MKAARYSNQTCDQIIAHLRNLLDRKLRYNLSGDPLGVYFVIRESTRRKHKQLSDKRKRIREEQKRMSKRQRKLSNTKKRIRPKIRKVKKGRVVKLQS